MIAMIKQYWIVILFIVSLSVFLFSKCSEDKKAIKGHTVKAQSFQTPSGWGYDVLINDSILIHQDNIPGRPGNQGFKTEEQALSVGNLIVNKIENKKGIPSVNPRELDSLGIK